MDNPFSGAIALFGSLAVILIGAILWWGVSNLAGAIVLAIGVGVLLIYMFGRRQSAQGEETTFPAP